MGRKGIGSGAVTMGLRRRWLVLLLVGATLFFLGTAFYLPTEHGQVADYARKNTKPAVPNAVAELTQEQRRERQERLDRELRAVEADHESIVHAMYPHPENGTCFGEVNIITQFPVLPEVLPELGEVKSSKDAEAIGKDRKYAVEKGPLHRRRRQEEYLDTLRKNLRNPHVKRIHLLLERESDLEFILAQGMPDVCGKLQPVPLGRWMHYRDAFEYAATKLPGELCMIMNADIYLAQGWQFATKALFERKTVPHVYVLARWEGPSVFCVEKPEDSCTTRARVGSYDAFVFLSPLPLDEGDLKAIDYQQNIWGAENRVLNVLQINQIGVSNPCKILQVGHNHCDAFFRPQQGMHEGQYRVPAGRAHMAPYTATL